MARDEKIDIWSKGEVVAYLSGLVDEGQIKPCSHLPLEHLGRLGCYAPRCKKEWASRVPAYNVRLDSTAYSAPSGYSWPQCPGNCPHFQESDNFELTASLDQYDKPYEEDAIEVSAAEPEEIAMPNSELNYPEKVTPAWLWNNVSWKVWLAGFSLLAASFVAGVNAAKYEIVTDLLQWESTKDEDGS